MHVGLDTTGGDIEQGGSLRRLSEHTGAGPGSGSHSHPSHPHPPALCLLPWAWAAAHCHGRKRHPWLKRRAATLLPPPGSTRIGGTTWKDTAHRRAEEETGRAAQAQHGVTTRPQGAPGAEHTPPCGVAVTDLRGGSRAALYGVGRRLERWRQPVLAPCQQSSATRDEADLLQRRGQIGSADG